MVVKNKGKIIVNERFTFESNFNYRQPNSCANCYHYSYGNGICYLKYGYMRRFENDQREAKIISQVKIHGICDEWR